MKDEPVSRPEFDLFVKVTADAMTKIADATAEQAKESKVTNKILLEHTITNNHKHERTAEELDYLKTQIRKLKAAVEANSKLTSIALVIKWAAGIIIVGGLTGIGYNMADRWYIAQHAPKADVVQKESTSGV